MTYAMKIQEERKEGIKEGIKATIHGTIALLRNLGQDDEQIRASIEKQFKLSPADAHALVYGE